MLKQEKGDLQVVNKKKLHHWLVVIRRVKLWQLIIIFVLLAFGSVYLLRQNNLKMVELRNLVNQADQDAGDVHGALVDLGQYVTSHMNTDLGEGIFLQHSYRRAYDQLLKQQADKVNPNSNVYQDAENSCRDQFGNQSFSLYLQCVQQKLASLAPGQDPLSNVKPPPQELFKYNFVSPKLSFDLAGFVVLITFLVGLIIGLRLTGYATLKLLLKQGKSS